MLRNTFVSGFVSLFFSLGNKPLQLWRTVTGDSPSSWVKLVTDEDLGSLVLELVDENVSSTRIECPPLASDSLGIGGMPYLVLQMKNLQGYVSFEIELLDDSKTVRRFRCSNFQLESRVREDITTMPLLLEPGWNTVTLDLAKMVFKAYGTQLKEFSGIVVHANTRIRRIYLAQELIAEENLPAEFKLFRK